MVYDYFIDPNLDENASPDFLIPIGDRILQVVKWEDAGLSANGDQKFMLDIKDIKTGKNMREWITLLPKGNPGAGITKKYLKILMGESADGNVSINPDEWIGVSFGAEISHEKGQNGKTYARIVISTLRVLEATEIPEDADLDKTLKEDLPF